MVELSLVSDKDLVEELCNRFDDFIMAGRKILTNSSKDGKGQEKTERRRYWKGDYDACVGLCMGTIQDCLNKNWGVKQDDLDYA